MQNTDAKVEETLCSVHS